MSNEQEGKERLTEEQCELATKNHNLIYAYACKRNILTDDYYDILAIGLCKAAKSFDKDKGNFSTFAFRCMDNELNIYWRSNKKKTSVPEEMVLSYDAPIDAGDSDGNSFAENITDNHSHDEVLDDIVLSIFMNNLTCKDRYIVDCLLNGMTHKEIGDTMGCKKQNVTYLVGKIRKKASHYLLNN